MIILIVKPQCCNSTFTDVQIVRKLTGLVIHSHVHAFRCAGGGLPKFRPVVRKPATTKLRFVHRLHTAGVSAPGA